MNIFSLTFVLLGVFGIIFSADVAVYATLALVPVWYVLRRSLHGLLGSLWAVQVEPSASDLLSLLAWTNSGKTPSLPRSALTYAFGALVVLTTLHVTMAVDLVAAVKFGAVTLYLILTMFLLQWRIDDEDTYRTLRHMYILSVLITAAVLVIAYVFWAAGLGSLVSDLMYGGGAGETSRPKGFFKDANVAGPFIVTGFGWMLSRLLLGRDQLNIRTVLVLAVLAGAIGVTFSRGALLNLAITTVATAWLAASNWRQRFNWLVIAGLLVGGGYAGSKVLFDSSGQADRFQAANAYDTDGRFVSWQAGWDTFLNHPLGIGPGQYEAYSTAFQTQVAWNASVTPSAHSTIMRVLAEGGFFGTLLIVLVFALVLHSGMTTLRRAQLSGRPFLYQEAVWTTAAVIGTLGEGIIIDTLHWRHLWVLCGLILAAHKLTQLAAPAPQDRAA